MLQFKKNCNRILHWTTVYLVFAVTKAPNQNLPTHSKRMNTVKLYFLSTKFSLTIKITLYITKLSLQQPQDIHDNVHVIKHGIKWSRHLQKKNPHIYKITLNLKAAYASII